MTENRLVEDMKSETTDFYTLRDQAQWRCVKSAGAPHDAPWVVGFDSKVGFLHLAYCPDQRDAAKIVDTHNAKQAHAAQMAELQAVLDNIVLAIGENPTVLNIVNSYAGTCRAFSHAESAVLAAAPRTGGG